MTAYILVWDKENKKIELREIGSTAIKEYYKFLHSFSCFDKYVLSEKEKNELDIYISRYFKHPIEITIIDSHKVQGKIAILCIIRKIDVTSRSSSVLHNRLLSVKDVANLFGVSPSTVRFWIYNNKIDVIKLGNAYYIPVSALSKSYKYQLYSREIMTEMFRDKIADIIYIFGVPKEIASEEDIKKGKPIIDIVKNVVYIPPKTLSRIRELLNVKSLKPIIKFSTSTLSINGKIYHMYKVNLEEFGDMAEWIRNRAVKDLQIEGLIS